LYRDEHYQVASGLVLGGSGRLAGELREVFARAGILHILAVSGLHVGFVGMFLGFLLLFVPLDYRTKFVVLMIGLFIYAGVTGFRPSVCRATVMAFLFGFAIVLQRNVDHIHVINITAIMFLLSNPLLIFDVSAQLSFAAVYGILYLYPKIDEWIIRKVKRKLRYLLTPMAVSFSAQLFVAPLLIYYFRRLPIYAVFANLLIVPIASVTIFLLFVCFLMGLFWFAPVEIIAVPVRLLIGLLIGFSRFVAGVPLSAIEITAPLFLLLPLYLLLWAKARRFVAWGAIVVLSIFSVARSVECLTVCIAAKSVLITVPSGASILVSTQKSTAQSVLMEKHGISDPDYLIAADQYRPVGSCFVTIPDNMYFKRFVYDELELYLTRDLRIKFRGEELEFDLSNLQDTAEIGVTTYILTNGHERHVVRGSLYCSIIEQLILDVQLVVARLQLLL
jgi:ComEC/Rec2-related protein